MSDRAWPLILNWIGEDGLPSITDTVVGIETLMGPSENVKESDVLSV